MLPTMVRSNQRFRTVAGSRTLPDGLTGEHPMNIARQRIVSILRLRGQQVRADWVERELPERVDPEEHAGLLALLRLDPADLVDAPCP